MLDAMERLTLSRGLVISPRDLGFCHGVDDFRVQMA